MGTKSDRRSQLKNLAFSVLGLLALLGTLTIIPVPHIQAQSAFQSWEICDDSGSVAIVAVDSAGNFGGSGWTADIDGVVVPISITQGLMSERNMTFLVSGSGSGWSGAGSGAGALNASFPSATSGHGDGKVRIENSVGSFIEWEFSWTANRNTAQPTYTTAPTPVITQTSTPAQIVTVAPDTSTAFKLGWTLFGRTDMTDEQAKAEYSKRAQDQLKGLETISAASDQRLAKLQNQYTLFQEAVNKQNLLGIAQALQADLAEAKKERNAALLGFGLPVAGLATSKELEPLYPTWANVLKNVRPGAETGVDITSSGVGGWQLGQFVNDAQAKIDKGQSLSQEDWRKFAEAAIGLATTFAAKPEKVLGVSNPIGMTASITGAILGGIELGLTERRVRIEQEAIKQSTISVEKNRQLLLNQIQIEKDRKEAFDRQKTLLTQDANRYLNLKG